MVVCERNKQQSVITMRRSRRTTETQIDAAKGLKSDYIATP